VLKESHAELEETSITAVTTMEDPYPSLFHAYRTQRDNPNIGSTRSNEQAREPLRIGKMRLMQMKASTFLVREQGFSPKSLGVQATRLLG
jgi:hypothetical protein